MKFFQEKNPHGLNFPFHAIYTRCIMVKTNIKIGYDSESKNERDYIFGGPCRPLPFVELSMARCPHIEIFPEKKSAWFEFPVPCYIHSLYYGANEYQNGL